MSSAIKKINVKNNTFTVNGETNSLKMYLFIRDVIFISLFETDAGWWGSHRQMDWPAKVGNAHFRLKRI
jgi:hypothetical protein